MTPDTSWHFPIMIFASLILFYAVIGLVIGKREFIQKFQAILLLSIACVVIGMLVGKYGATWGLAWWIYYPIPMLMNVLLPPIILNMQLKKRIMYVAFSFLSAPVIHLFFSFLFNWGEYMSFWKIPYIKALIT